MIRVFVVDDHPVVVQGTVTYLGAEADMEVVGHATEGADALDAVAGDVAVARRQLAVVDEIEPHAREARFEIGRVDGIDPSL